MKYVLRTSVLAIVAAILAVSGALASTATADTGSVGQAAGTAASDGEPIIHSELIPNAIARRVDRYHLRTFRVNVRVLPQGLTADTFRELVARTGARWGLSDVGTTTSSPMRFDGKNTVGFSRALSGDLLGRTTIYRKLYYGRRKNGRRYVRASRVVEEDLALAYNTDWNFGPGYPSAENYDLESVLIHEFGHFAGNEHVRRCRNSPMAATIDAGDWWRGVNDWRRFGCGASAAGSRSYASPVQTVFVSR